MWISSRSGADRRARGRVTCAGFTLAELLAVIVVVAVVVAIALPAASRASGPYRLDGEAAELRTALTDARARAIAEGRAYRFRVQGGTRYGIEARGASGWEPAHGPVRLPGGIVIDLDGASGGSIEFHPSGHAGSAVLIQLRSGGRARSIRVLRSGLIRSERRAT